MAVTFDNNQNLSDMVYYNGVTSVSRNLTTGDFFDDTAAAEDRLYFTWDRGVWHDLTVNVGTPLVADAITLAWEYYERGVGWMAIPGVVDNTNGFQNAGVNTVSFPVPTAWRYLRNVGVSTNDGSMIRARITAVTNISEGGANQTTAVFGKDYAIKVTGDETLASIKTANDGGGWNVVNNTANFYEIISNLRLEGNLVIQRQTLNVGTTVDRRVILKTSGILQLGYKDGSDNIYSGSTLNYFNIDSNYMSPYNYWYGTLNMYNSILFKMYGGFGDYALRCLLDIQSSALETVESIIYLTLCTGSVKNITFSTDGAAYVYWDSTATIDHLVFGRAPGILAAINGVIVSNTDFGTDKLLVLAGTNRSIEAINCSFDDVATQVEALSYAGAKIYVKYTLGLTLVDAKNNPIAGYGVKLTNKDNDVLNDGAWTDMDVVTFVSERNASAVLTETDYNDFTIIITKAGYQTYKSVFTIHEKKDLVIRLKHSNVCVDQEVMLS